MAEQDNNFASNAVPEVQNKASKPPGILPKNAQTWIILGIAVLMILVISFSNSGTPKPKTREAANRQGTTPTQNRIDEYRAMVDEEARRLAVERQRAEQSRAQAQAAAAAAAQLQYPPLNPIYAGSQNLPYQSSGYGPPPPSPVEVQRAALENERRKREYASLFSPNVALSFRRDQMGIPTTGQRMEADDPLQALQAMEDQLNVLRQSAPLQGQPVAVPVTQVAPSAELNGGAANDAVAAGGTQGQPAEMSPAEKGKQADDPKLQQANGKKYRLFEGTIIETVLTNRLNGSFSGPVNVMVTTSVHSHDRQQLLIPQGTRILGEVQRVSTFGQQRLAVFFHRLIMPDGYSMSLDQFQGLNQIGETGLRDKVNNHYLQTFGVSLAIGAIAGVAQANTQYGFGVSGADAYRQGVATSLSQSSMRILDRYLNILPTFVIREGHRIKVHLTNDILLPAYGRHRIPKDL